jgi:hypothetical protein
MAIDLAAIVLCKRRGALVLADLLVERTAIVEFAAFELILFGFNV